jgi:hypothetical protein
MEIIDKIMFIFWGITIVLGLIMVIAAKNDKGNFG